MKRILVPTDFSDTSRLAVGHALELADAVGADLLLLHVVDEGSLHGSQLSGIREVFAMTVDPTGNAFSYEVPREEGYRALCEEAEWKLAALLPPFDSDRLRPLVVVGNVVDEIIRVARAEKASLIIMGIQGRKGWRHLHLDSVAERVIQRSPVPVMTLWVPRSATIDRGRRRDLVFRE